MKANSLPLILVLNLPHSPTERLEYLIGRPVFSRERSIQRGCLDGCAFRSLESRQA